MKRSASVEEYIENHPLWTAELLKLRKILGTTELEESIKWGAPSYSLGSKLVVGIGAFKSYVGLWFHQGVHLVDPDKVLINAQEGTTVALRQWRFESAKEITAKRVKPYVLEAIENQKQGKQVKPDRNKPVVVPPELVRALAAKPKAKQAFAKLGQGKQREFAEYISTAKREATKATRLEKILPMIAAGVGLNDKYRNC